MRRRATFPHCRVTALVGLLVAGATGAAPLAYVPNQASGTVSVIDTASDRVVRTLDAHGSLGKRLQAIDIDAHGMLYLVDAANESLLVLDPVHDAVVRRLAIGKGAEGVRLAPDGRSVAVCAEAQHQVLLADTATLALRARIPVRGRNPEHCEFSPDGQWLLTSNEGSDNLDVIDVAHARSVATIATGGHPRGAAFVPHTEHVFVAQESANAVDVVDLAARAKIASIPTAERAAGVTASADGRRVYVANGSGSVSVIDVAKSAVVATIPVGKRPWNMALTPDGRKLYVANGRSGSVSVVDTATLKVIAEIPVGELPWGVAIARAGE